MTETQTRSVLLIGALVVAAGFAAFRKQPSAEVRLTDQAPRATESLHPSMEDEGADDEALPPGHPPIGDQPEGEQGEALPPGHPPIGGGNAAEVAADGESTREIRWSMPAKWHTAANASPMRLATYHVPAAGGAADEAELTVVRAGGSTEANLKRWAEQFEHATNEKRAEKTIHGLKVSTIEVQGDFKKGAMGSDTATMRSGWMLLGAVVEAKESSYFFKLTGPTASVRGARTDFDDLVHGIAPISSGATDPAAK